MRCVCIYAPHLTGEDGLPSLLWVVGAVLSKEIWASAKTRACYNKRGNSSSVNLVGNDGSRQSSCVEWSGDHGLGSGSASEKAVFHSVVTEHHTVVHSCYYHLWLTSAHTHTLFLHKTPFYYSKTGHFFLPSVRGSGRHHSVVMCLFVTHIKQRHVDYDYF